MMKTNTQHPTADLRELIKRIRAVDSFLARRFARLEGNILKTAQEGIERHLRACDGIGGIPDGDAIREIIEDSIAGRNYYAVVDNDRQGFSSFQR